MFKNLKNKLKKNFEIFSLVSLIIITAIFTTLFNHKKNFNNNTYNSFVDNIYLKKTFQTPPAMMII